MAENPPAGMRRAGLLRTRNYVRQKVMRHKKATKAGEERSEARNKAKDTTANNPEAIPQA